MSANTKQNYFNRARLSFLGIGNKTFSLSSRLYIFWFYNDPRWKVAGSTIQFLAYCSKLSLLLSRPLLS